MIEQVDLIFSVNGLLNMVNGVFTVFFVVISILIGFKIIFKYFELGRIELFTIGLTWIFISSAWWGSTTNFIVILLNNPPLDDMLYLFLSNAFIPLILICWTYSLTHIFYPEKESLVLKIFIPIAIIYEVLFITFIFTAPDLIGYVEGVSDSKPSNFLLGFQIFTLIICISGGILFSKKSIEQDNSEIKWKGIFLLLGFLIFTMGALLDILFPPTIFSLILIRLILVLSGIFYYSGFFLPKTVSSKLRGKT